MQDYRNILIVDDSETSRMIIQRCLEMVGLCPTTFIHAENGLAALAQLKDRKNRAAIDLVLTDLNMPKMDGRAFARILKGTPEFKDLPLFIVSSVADGDVEVELRALGAKAMIKKPVTPAKLAEVLEGGVG